MLQQYGFQSCLLNHDEALATVLAALPEWQKVYEDETSILFVRGSGSPASGAQISIAAPDSGHGL
jgi:uroporphyrinogen-III synthase